MTDYEHSPWPDDADYDAAVNDTGHPRRGDAAWTCAVCGQGINRFDSPHTFHAEGCPSRDVQGARCHYRYGCGEDVHSSCCPTCTGQAFALRAATTHTHVNEQIVEHFHTVDTPKDDAWPPT